jgi:hypothetical protein
MRPELGAMSTLVTSLSCPLRSSFSLKALPTLLYSSTELSLATATVEWSPANEWSAIGAWNKWWTSGADMTDRTFVIGVALYYHKYATRGREDTSNSVGLELYGSRAACAEGGMAGLWMGRRKLQPHLQF